MLADVRPVPLIPDEADIQSGYDLPCRELAIRGSVVRLFTLSGETPDPDRTVVCLPGMGASGRSFAPLAPLADRYHFLFWTPPLHTGKDETPLALNVRLLEAPSAPLPPRFVLVGSSYGSLIALAFALAHPERVKALVLANPVASARRIRRAAMMASLLMRVPVPFAYVFAPVVARLLGGRHLPPAGRAEFIREARRISPYELARRLKDILMADLMPLLPGLAMPTLIVHGGRDRIVPLSAARDVAERIPRSKLVVIEKAAHLPYMSHPREFNAALEEFLAAQERPTGRYDVTEK